MQLRKHYLALQIIFRSSVTLHQLIKNVLQQSQVANSIKLQATSGVAIFPCQTPRLGLFGYPHIAPPQPRIAPLCLCIQTMTIKRIYLGEPPTFKKGVHGSAFYPLLDPHAPENMLLSTLASLALMAASASPLDPSSNLEKRVYACPTGTLVCCHVTRLQRLHTAEGCMFPPFPILYPPLGFVTSPTFRSICSLRYIPAFQSPIPLDCAVFFFFSGCSVFTLVACVLEIRSSS